MRIEQLNSAMGVLIVDDHDGYRSVAAEVVEATEGFEVIGTVADRDQALQVLEQRRDDVDLVLMDVHLGTSDGVALTSEITQRAIQPVQVVLVTAMAYDDLPHAARSCGARGYLPKAELSPLTLVQASRGVYDWRDVEPARGTRR